MNINLFQSGTTTIIQNLRIIEEARGKISSHFNGRARRSIEAL